MTTFIFKLRSHSATRPLIACRIRILPQSVSPPALKVSLSAKVVQELPLLSLASTILHLGVCVAGASGANDFADGFGFGFGFAAALVLALLFGGGGASGSEFEPSGS